MRKIFFMLLLSVNMVQAQVKPDSVWMNQKFSMFIHWGLYSELGGVWDGKPVLTGYSEQIQSHGGIFSDWYGAVARRFDPEKWNADSIVSLARRAGMKSIVFTSKHHDGFCMYHSAYTDYNIVDATPFKRDAMKELADACKRQGMRFGVYFSLIDWHFPQAYPISSHNADPLTPEHYDFNRKQVEEIMTGYGDISEIWFDMGSLTPEQSSGLYELVNSLQPACMISGRLGNDCSDFSVMGDNEYPDYKIGVPWQTAASFFDETWGYRSWQERGKVRDKANEKIRSLIKVVSRGGNYLLNIGPKGDGSVVSFEKEVLLDIGTWLGKYGEGIYGAKANPFDHSFEWGDVTVKGNRIYLFVDKEKMPDCLELSGLRGNITGAWYIGGKEVAVGREKGIWSICDLRSGSQPDSPVTVICIDMDGGYVIEPCSVVGGKLLTSRNSVPLYAYSSMDYYTGFQSTIAYTWNFRSGKSGVRPSIYYTDNEKGKKIVVEIDGVKQDVVLDEGETVRKKSSGVYWGKTYCKPSGSIFGSVPGESNPVDISAENSGWKEWGAFKLDEKMELPALERESFLFFQELESDRVQDILVRIGSGNGIQVILNGELITVHTSGRGNLYSQEVVLLPLKKGKNQLLLKLYNRFEKNFCFSLETAVEQKFYKMDLNTFPLQAGNLHRCCVRLLQPHFVNSAMRLNNLKIVL